MTIEIWEKNREQQCILPKQFSQIAKQSTEVTQLLVAWTKADMKKLERICSELLNRYVKSGNAYA